MYCKFIYKSEKLTGDRNRAMAYLLKNDGFINGDVEEILDLYFKQCSIEIDCVIPIFSGTEAITPPPTPDFAGIPTLIANSPDASYIPQVLVLRDLECIKAIVHPKRIDILKAFNDLPLSAKNYILCFWIIVFFYNSRFNLLFY